jgi:hypothetical protein
MLAHKVGASIDRLLRSQLDLIASPFVVREARHPFSGHRESRRHRLFLVVEPVIGANAVLGFMSLLLTR